MTDTSSLLPQAEAVLRRYTQAGLTLAAAESCTGGLIAALLTDLPGASAVVERGFVTYSNDAKTDLLGVPADMIAAHGAVSREVAMAMAEGALAASRADAAVSVTGIAGPGGGSPAKPVGLVQFGFARKGRPVHHVERRFGALERSEIRRAAVAQALEGLLHLID